MPTLLDDTLDRLRNAPRWLSLSQVAAESGLKLAWLSAFASGAISDPGVKKVQQLHDYLMVVPTSCKPESLPFDGIKAFAAGDNLQAWGVYVFFAGDVCVYVGSSMNLGRRLKEQSRNRDILAMNPTHVSITYFTEYTEFDKARMLAYEAAKIRALKPVLNVRHSGVLA